MATSLSCTKDNPWKLKTPPGTSAFTTHTDEKKPAKDGTVEAWGCASWSTTQRTTACAPSEAPGCVA